MEINIPHDGARSVAVIVAHPDDETLWAGGTLLLHPAWHCSIFTLCRASDPDRAPRFHRVLERLGASGGMGDLDDGPAQNPLPDDLVQDTLEALYGPAAFDLVLTHSPNGEYTTHRRHIEVSRAARALWERGRLRADALWLFAYDDGGGAYLPRPQPNAPLQVALPQAIWEEKYRIIREVYGFAPESWEARTTPRAEAFWPLAAPQPPGAPHRFGVGRGA